MVNYASQVNSEFEIHSKKLTSEGKFTRRNS